MGAKELRETVSLVVPARRLAPRLLLLGVGLASWLVVLATVNAAVDLRPLSDDYCHAAESAPGFLGAVAFWYQSWIGDAFQVSVTTLLVGLPLANLPLWVASLIPFLLTAVAVASLVLFAALGRARADARARLVGIAVALPVGLIAWWGFWWISALIDPGPENPAMELARTATSWQTVNVQYALVPALVLSALLLLERRRWRVGFDAAAFAVLGLLAGLSGLVFAAAILVFAPVVVAARSYLSGAVRRREIVRAAAFLAGGVVGLGIAGAAPGLRGRVAVAEPPLDPATPGALLHWILPEGVLMWLDGILTPGTAAVVAIGAGLAIVIRAARIRLDPRHVALAATGFAGLALVVAVAARGAEAFSYVAVWHLFMPRSLIFVAAVLAGIAVGTRVLATRSRFGGLSIAAAAGVAIALAVGGVLAMHSAIETRRVTWEVGPAPGGGPDIETTWVTECWDRWADDRDLPPRSG